jgi:hypothetical protein
VQDLRLAVGFELIELGLSEEGHVEVPCVNGTEVVLSPETKDHVGTRQEPDDARRSRRVEVARKSNERDSGFALARSVPRAAVY